MVGGGRWALVQRAVASSLLCVALLAGTAQAAPLTVELNGREFYGTTFTEGPDLFVPLDVVGPLLAGPDLVVEEYDVVLRRARLRFVPSGAAQPQRVYVVGCAKRGSVVYGPLQGLVKALGGSLTQSADVLAASYPPVSAAAASATGTDRKGGADGKPAAGVALGPASTPLLSPEEALREAKAANAPALAHVSAFKRLEIYHPLSPEPADAIPRSEVAGLKVYVAGLGERDQVLVELWSGRDPAGKPVFSRSRMGFTAEEREQGAFFVRLPLEAAPGWHVVRLVHSKGERVEYRFVTF